MRSRVGRLLIVATTALVLGGGASPPAASSDTSLESDFIARTNAERVARGLSRFESAGDVTRLSRRHSEEMAQAGEIWHTPDLGDRVDDWKALGENVGMGPSVESLHIAFMRSADHRANILFPAFDHLSVGVALNKDATIYVTVIFIDRRARAETSHRSAGHVSRARPPAHPSPARHRSPRPSVTVSMLERQNDTSFDPTGRAMQWLDDPIAVARWSPGAGATAGGGVGLLFAGWIARRIWGRRRKPSAVASGDAMRQWAR